jgi:hypothetical protein
MFVKHCKSAMQLWQFIFVINELPRVIIRKLLFGNKLGSAYTKEWLRLAKTYKNL